MEPPAEEPPAEEPPVEDTPPHVSLVYPVDGDVVTGVVTIQVLATDEEDPDGALAVQVGVGPAGSTPATWRQTGYNDTNGYYEMLWDTTACGGGTDFTIHASATDSMGDAHTTFATPVIVMVANTPPPRSEMYVASKQVDTVYAGRGKRKGRATILIRSEAGDPVANATVVGTFGGTITETVSGVTDASGKAILETTQQKSWCLYVTFTVDNVTHPDYVYEPDNPNPFSWWKIW
jgi:hypothetical protein